jgi:hypothetical protein
MAATVKVILDTDGSPLHWFRSFGRRGVWGRACKAPANYSTPVSRPVVGLVLRCPGCTAELRKYYPAAQ